METMCMAGVTNTERKLLRAANAAALAEGQALAALEQAQQKYREAHAEYLAYKEAQQLRAHERARPLTANEQRVADAFLSTY